MPVASASADHLLALPIPGIDSVEPSGVGLGRRSAAIDSALGSDRRWARARRLGELLFNLVASRYERRSVLITTNLSFVEWTKVFGGDEKLTTALLHRLAHHATVITTRGKSSRMRKRGEGSADASSNTATPGKTC